MKQRFKYVGIGLFLAGLLITLNSQFNFIASGSTNTNDKALEKKEREIEKLHKQLQEVNEDLKNAKSNENKSKEDNTSNANNTSTETNNNTSFDQNQNASTENKDGVVTGTVIIYENMSLYDIGQQVEDLKILKNGRELELYLSKPEYSRSIQKGSFELSSDMTLEEMAKILTAKKTQ